MEQERIKSRWSTWGELKYMTFFPESLLEFYEFMTAKIVSVLI